jgi:multiple sugar transport system substrate-binding protein
MQSDRRASVTRRQALKTSATGLLTASAVGIAPRFLFSPGSAKAEGLAPGMTGGPSGFSGAERYQYNESQSEGRAIEGIKKLKAAGKAPAKLSILIADGAIAHFTKPYPASAPLAKDVWEKETGVELVFVGVPPADKVTRILQDVTTKSGAFDIYVSDNNALGDLNELNAVVPLDDFVGRYQPDFSDPSRGTETKEIYELLYRFGNRTLAVCLDADFQVWAYRKDLFDDQQNQKEFADQHGFALVPPATWKQADAMMAFFTKKGLTGNGNMMSPFWGISNWYNRFTSMGKPNQFLFDESAQPLIASDAGVEATQAHINSAKWAPSDALSWDWAEYYGAFGQGKSVMICTFDNLPKFTDRLNEKGEPTSPVTGKVGSFLPPGTVVGGELIRRSTHYLGNTALVSAQSKYPEAAYLFLQWAGSTRIFSWLTANIAGYFDPFQQANFTDPLVIDSYHSYCVPIIRETIKRANPTLNIPGAIAIHRALDENLQAAIVGQATAKEAMDRTADAWRTLIKKRGEKKIAEALNASRAAWSTVIDKA